MKLDLENIPQHIAIIMDGNGRWAKQRSKVRALGHREGVKAVERTFRVAAKLKIKYLTLYTFSTENWNRPKEEVNALMTLLATALDKNKKKLIDANIKLKVIGDIDSLPTQVKKKINKVILSTQKNTGMHLVLALSYSARWEITNAVKEILQQKEKPTPETITEEYFSQYLTTKDIPDPELMIRTGGETRISNFLLWQLAYSELYFINKFWPDFSEKDFEKAIIDYQNRERRFGQIEG